MNFAYLHQADELLKSAYKQFHRIMTKDALYNDFLNFYEYENDTPKEITEMDAFASDFVRERKILQKNSYFSPLDMEDLYRLDCLKFLPAKFKEQARYSLADEDNEIVPLQIEALKEKGIPVPDDVTTKDQIWEFLDKYADNNDISYEEIGEELQDIERDVLDRDAFNYVFDIFLNVEEIDENAAVLTLRMRMDILSETAVVYESPEFDPANASERKAILDAFVAWAENNYDSTPWLNRNSAPQPC